MIKRVLTTFLACILLCVTAFADTAAGGGAPGDVLAFQMKSDGFSDIQEWLEGSENAEPYIFALKQYAGLDLSAFGGALEAKLSENRTSSPVTKMKYALELIACGFPDSAHISGALDIVPAEQGVMPLVYALHLLNNGCTADFTADEIIDELLKRRLPDGGWAVMGEHSDIDVTAMALQALAPHREQAEAGQAAAGALELLADSQLPDGDFRSMGKDNCESTAQVILALAALGRDPFTDERFIKNGNTLSDGLLKYRLPDGGFCHEAGGAPSVIASSQAFSALVCAGTGRPLLLFGGGEPPALVPAAAEEQGEETDPAEAESRENEADVPRKTSYKPVAVAMIAGITALACLILFPAKKRHIKNFIFTLALGAAAAAFVLLTDFRGKDEYYSADEIPADEIAGHAAIAIFCDTVAGEAAHIPADGVILPETRLPFRENATVYDLLVSAAKKYELQIENSGSAKLAYISSVQNISEFDFGALSGWMYFVNGESPSVGCGEFVLSDGDRVEWRYTRDIGSDLA